MHSYEHLLVSFDFFYTCAIVVTTVFDHVHALGASLYHSRQCGIVFKPRSDGTDYTVVRFITHNCS